MAETANQVHKVREVHKDLQAQTGLTAMSVIQVFKAQPLMDLTDYKVQLEILEFQVRMANQVMTGVLVNQVKWASPDHAVKLDEMVHRASRDQKVNLVFLASEAIKANREQIKTRTLTCYDG